MASTGVLPFLRGIDLSKNDLQVSNNYLICVIYVCSNDD